MSEGWWDCPDCHHEAEMPPWTRQLVSREDGLDSVQHKDLPIRGPEELEDFI